MPQACVYKALLAHSNGPSYFVHERNAEDTEMVLHEVGSARHDSIEFVQRDIHKADMSCTLAGSKYLSCAAELCEALHRSR